MAKTGLVLACANMVGPWAVGSRISQKRRQLSLNFNRQPFFWRSQKDVQSLRASPSVAPRPAGAGAASVVHVRVECRYISTAADCMRR